jgi:lipoate---protein ligase
VASAESLLGSWPSPDQQDERMARAGRVSGRPAVVLGTTQDRSAVDERAAAVAGVDVLQRSTGGGAVLVAPGAQVWFDLWIPRRDELWCDDVVRSALWLGRVWADALAELGAPALEVHAGGATRSPQSELICFAGLGPGEVSVAEGTGRGAKLVGIAQRRTRHGARYHASAALRWDPGPLLHLLRGTEHLDPSSLRQAATGLRAVVPEADEPVSDGALLSRVEESVFHTLP